MIITIGRECGCNGNKIGRALAEKYHMAFYDKSVISKKAQEMGLYDRYPDFYREVPGSTLMYTISMEEDEESVLYETPKKALSGLIGTKDCVILGRCGNWAFKDRKDKISIFLTGDEKWRTENIARKQEISARSAKQKMSQTDERRKSYHEYYTGQTWGDAKNYDLCLNVTDLGVDGALAVIETYLQQSGIEAGK